MAKSKLTDYTKISPNRTSPRTMKVDRITPHCYVGQASIESMAGWLCSPAAQASANYGIGADGRVVCLVDEADRSWCSSSGANDHRAITIECASDSFDPYKINDKVYDKLIDLMVDICQRYGKKKLLWIGDKNTTLSYTPRPDEMVLTVHRWFANKSCVPVDSEVLTREGWVRIADIEIGDEIACADLDNLRITFEEVYDKVPEREQDTYTNNELTATKDHRMVYWTQSNKTCKISEYKNLLSYGSQVYIPLAGYVNADGLDMTDEMLCFLTAVQADGHYMYENKVSGEKSYYGVEFHLQKQRKIERIKQIIEGLHLPYREIKQSNGTIKIRIYNNDGINIVNDICEKYLSNKCFTWNWINLSPEQAKIFLKETLFWDGCEAANLYTSRESINLDVVNAIAALNGVGSRVVGSNVQFRGTPYITLGTNTKRNPRRPNSRNTLVSCVSVKTGIFLMRQQGKTFIVGNCPGDYIYNRLGKIADTVTKRLSGSSDSAPAEKAEYAPSEWIAMIAPIAQDLARKYSVLPSVVIAQTALETGWGLTDLTRKYNIVGVKADLINSTWKEHSTWDGATYRKVTPEYHNGKLIHKEDDFRVYHSFRECLEDYVNFLLYVRNDKGYKYRRLQGLSDPKTVINIIKTGTGTNTDPEGYCTDPNYETKILNLIKEYKLTKYDEAMPDYVNPNAGPPEPVYSAYRVWVGSYKAKKNSDLRQKKLKTVADMDTFVEKDGKYHVYCGSFSAEENAKARVEELNARGIRKAEVRPII